MRGIVRTALGLVLVLGVSQPKLPAQNENISQATVAIETAKFVIPILDKMEEALRGPRPLTEQEGSPFRAVGILTGKVIRNNSRASDEALVVLLFYNIGEANNEDQQREVILRGKRMLPYLRKYQLKSPAIRGKRYENIFLPLPTVEEELADTIHQISTAGN